MTGFKLSPKASPYNYSLTSISLNNTRNYCVYASFFKAFGQGAGYSAVTTKRISIEETNCVTELKLSTLRSVALDVARLKQKHTYREKNIQPISLKTSWPWYRQTSDCCWRNISARDSSTETRNTPW